MTGIPQGRFSQTSAATLGANAWTKDYADVYWVNHNVLMQAHCAMLFIPESAVPAVKALGGKKPQNGAAVTRQQMAAVFYRTLRFIEESKVYSYTEYTSRLDRYNLQATATSFKSNKT